MEERGKRAETAYTLYVGRPSYGSNLLASLGRSWLTAHGPSLLSYLTEGGKTEGYVKSWVGNAQKQRKVSI